MRTSRLITLTASSRGWCARISAAAAETRAVAKLVPVTRQYPSGRAAIRSAAGALSATCGPVTEPVQAWASRVRPETASTELSRAGYQTWSLGVGMAAPGPPPTGAASSGVPAGAVRVGRLPAQAMTTASCWAA